MQPLENLTDDEIDSLLLHLFNGGSATQSQSVTPSDKPQCIEDISHEELLRIRSRNHPDKWPNVNQAAYQAAVEELTRRRKTTI